MLSTFNFNAQSHFSEVIGKLEGTSATITYDLDALKQKWQSALYNGPSSIAVVFTNISIVDEGSYYVLIGSNANNSIKSAIELVLDGDNFYELSYSGNGRTVTCTGCAAGCTPTKIVTGWICADPCTACIKTETVTEDKAIIDSDY